MGQQTSHVSADKPKVGLARWYGPARVLATETTSAQDPLSRKPGSIVWVVGAGRLKRCSPHQLRHCSEKERILAEASESVTTPWSFNSLMHLVERGQFEKYDEVADEEDNPTLREFYDREVRRGRSRNRVRASSVPIGEKEKKKTSQRPHKDPEPKGQGPQKNGERRPRRPAEAPEETERKKTKTDTRGSSSGSKSNPKGSLFSHPTFKEAQQRLGGESEKTLADLLNEGKSYVLDEQEETAFVFQISIPLPETQRDVKAFVRDSENWVTKKMKQGSELTWSQIPKDRIADFQKAKDKEISNWVRENAVRLVHHEVPESRTIRMRWIYTLKADNSAKARIVIVGYQDPDLGSLQTASPTMSRRSRGLFLTAAAVKRWTCLKGDVRAAFLQGLESERDREIFAKPVAELSERLGGGPDSKVQLLKACYGLANAPAQWFTSVAATMLEAGFEQLLTEPCGWRLVDRSNPQHPVLLQWHM